MKKTYLISTLSVMLSLAVWELLALKGIGNPLLVGRPDLVILSGYRLILSGYIFPHAIASLTSFLIGFILASLIGYIVGVLYASSRSIAMILKPYVFMLNAVPMVAFIPLFIMWFGIGIASKILIIFLMAFPTIMISVSEGVAHANRGLFLMAKSFGASRWQTAKTIAFPISLPAFFAGMKLAVGRSVVGLVIGEFIGFGIGLGYLVSYYGNSLQTNSLLFVIILLFLINAGSVKLIQSIEKKVLIWNH